MSLRTTAVHEIAVSEILPGDRREDDPGLKASNQEVTHGVPQDEGPCRYQLDDDGEEQRLPTASELDTEMEMFQFGDRPYGNLGGKGYWSSAKADGAETDELPNGREEIMVA